MEHAHRFLFEQKTDAEGMCKGKCACGAETKQFGGDWQAGITRKQITIKPDMVARTRDLSRDYFVGMPHQTES
jgi:hypothetical protein